MPLSLSLWNAAGGLGFSSGFSFFADRRGQRAREQQQLSRLLESCSGTLSLCCVQSKVAGRRGGNARTRWGTVIGPGQPPTFVLEKEPLKVYLLCSWSTTAPFWIHRIVMSIEIASLLLLVLLPGTNLPGLLLQGFVDIFLYWIRLFCACKQSACFQHGTNMPGLLLQGFVDIFLSWIWLFCACKQSACFQQERNNLLLGA